VTAPVSKEMTCQEFVELVTDLIEGRLVASVRLEAEAHLDECKGCPAYLEQMRHTIAGLRALAASEDFPRTRERAIAVFAERRGGSPAH
jgi:anti-sigma factor RsiW